MSYDIYLRGTVCDKCGQSQSGPELSNPTYNLTPIFHFALTGEGMPNPEISEGEAVVLHKKTDSPRGLRVLNGKRAGDTLEMLTSAIARLEDPTLRAALRVLEPSNGWGTLEGARETLCELYRAASGHPSHVWEVR